MASARAARALTRLKELPQRPLRRGIRYLQAQRRDALLGLFAVRGYAAVLLLGGTPDLLLALASCARQVTVTGLAADDDLRARLRAQKLRVMFAPDADGVAGLAFPDAAFDGVLVPDGLEQQPEPDAAAAELARVTAPGGTLVIGAPVSDRLRRMQLPFGARRTAPRPHTGTAVIRALAPHYRRVQLVTYPPFLPVTAAMFYAARLVRA